MNPHMCACCYDKSRTDIGQFICPRCVNEWRIINRLYSVAVLKFPSLRKKSISEFVRIIWAKLGLDTPKDIRYTSVPSKKATKKP
jgi:hypothetical protein